MLIMSKFAYMFIYLYVYILICLYTYMFIYLYVYILICLYTNNTSVKKIEIRHIYMVIRVYGFLLLF
jgi:hypothetical protein